MTNVGLLLFGLLIGEATNVSPVHLHLSDDGKSWLFIISMVLKGVGTQWQGMAAADNSEVKHQLGLSEDGSRPANALLRSETEAIPKNGGAGI